MNSIAHAAYAGTYRDVENVRDVSVLIDADEDARCCLCGQQKKWLHFDLEIDNRALGSASRGCLGRFVPIIQIMRALDRMSRLPNREVTRVHYMKLMHYWPHLSSRSVLSTAGWNEYVASRAD